MCGLPLGFNLSHEKLSYSAEEVSCIASRAGLSIERLDIYLDPERTVCVRDMDVLKKVMESDTGLCLQRSKAWWEYIFLPEDGGIDQGRREQLDEVLEGYRLFFKALSPEEPESDSPVRFFGVPAGLNLASFSASLFARAAT